jgi:hypothetical protein
MEKEIKKNETLEETAERVESSGGKISIHTMPRRYMASAPTPSSAKSTGLIILVAGFFFLVAALVALYYLVIRQPDRVTVEPDIATSTPEKTVSPKPTPTKPKPDEEPISQPPIDDGQASSSDTVSSSTSAIGDDDLVPSGFSLPIDRDKDGLSDIEELLLTSSPNSQDTDGDGYKDNLELINLYDPASKGRLVDSLSIEELVNEDYNFLIFVASLWTVNKVAGNDSIVISLSNDQFVQIISQKKETTQDLADWYKETFEVLEVKDSQIFKKGNWNGVMKEDKLTVYLEHPDKSAIITVSYSLGDDKTLYYKNMFDMMLQSIAIND